MSSTKKTGLNCPVTQYAMQQGIAAATKTNIKAARTLMGDTQTQAAELVHAKLRTWQDWEAGKAKINPAAWELYLIKAVERRSSDYKIWLLEQE